VALYFFHLRDGEDVLLDPEGSEVADLAAVRKQALLSARSILSAGVLEGQLSFDMRIDVEDEAGALVYRLPFQDAVIIVPPQA
jgi:hypothetical protein